MMRTSEILKINKQSSSAKQLLTLTIMKTIKLIFTMMLWPQLASLLMKRMRSSRYSNSNLLKLTIRSRKIIRIIYFKMRLIMEITFQMKLTKFRLTGYAMIAWRKKTNFQKLFNLLMALYKYWIMISAKTILATLACVL